MRLLWSLAEIDRLRLTVGWYIPEQLEHDLHGSLVSAVNATHDARANDGVAPPPDEPMVEMAVPPSGVHKKELSKTDDSTFYFLENGKTQPCGFLYLQTMNGSCQYSHFGWLCMKFWMLVSQ
jgi:hypothetical protein